MPLLVISRRIGESFLIGDDIEATIVDITGEKVVLGINAPREIPVTRLELSREIADANRRAVENSGKINSRGFSKLYKARFPGKKDTNE